MRLIGIAKIHDAETVVMTTFEKPGPLSHGQKLPLRFIAFSSHSFTWLPLSRAHAIKIQVVSNWSPNADT